MKKLLAFLVVGSVLGHTAPANAANLCGNNSRAIQCQTVKGGTGNGFYNPKMDPRFNPQVDPRLNPQADPRFNPGATPCDLGIGRNCPKR